MRYVFITLAFLFIPAVNLYAGTSGILFGPINGRLGAPGTGFGGVSCEGEIDSDRPLATFGTVTIDRITNDEVDNLIVTVILKNGDNLAEYTVEIFEASTTCGSNNMADTGVILSANKKGDGQAVVTLQLPHSSPEHGTIGDGIGTESIIVILDMVPNDTFSFDGNRFATKPIKIPAKFPSPHISASATNGTQQVTIFKIIGNGFTPSASLIPRLKEPDGEIITITSNLSADNDGNVSLDFTPTCDTEIGASKLWLIEDKSDIISNTVELNIEPNQNCAGDFSAEFSVDSFTGTAPLKVKFIDKTIPDPVKGEPANWIWNFGDGKTSSEQNPEHTYLLEGIYTVGLMVSNDLVSDWEIKTKLISVTPNSTPTARFTASHFIGIAPMKVQFTDLSDNNPDSWTWDFGDGGISNLQNSIHTYKEAGFYTVTLSVSNSNGSESLEKINLINVLDEEEPIAKFLIEPPTGFSPLTCNFTDLSSGNIGAWRWDFGDGEISSLKNPSHTYKGPGIFTVNLTVDGPKGTHQETKTIDVMDGLNSGSNLMAGFTGKPRAGNPGIAVEFKDISSGKVSGWLWDFGDNGTSTAQNPKHVYTEKGVYPVSLTVFNKEGKADTKTRLAYIEIKDQTIKTLLETPTPVPTPASTPDPTITVTPTPVETTSETSSKSEMNVLTVEPTTAKSSIRLQEAVVTFVDENGNPVPDITINAFTSGLTATVTPSSTITGDDGTAIFKFRFSSFTDNAKIIFDAEGITVKISQE